VNVIFQVRQRKNEFNLNSERREENMKLGRRFLACIIAFIVATSAVFPWWTVYAEGAEEFVSIYTQNYNEMNVGDVMSGVDGLSFTHNPDYQTYVMIDELNGNRFLKFGKSTSGAVFDVKKSFAESFDGYGSDKNNYRLKFKLKADFGGSSCNIDVGGCFFALQNVQGSVYKFMYYVDGFLDGSQYDLSEWKEFEIYVKNRTTIDIYIDGQIAVESLGRRYNRPFEELTFTMNSGLTGSIYVDDFDVSIVNRNITAQEIVTAGDFHSAASISCKNGAQASMVTTSVDNMEFDVSKKVTVSELGSSKDDVTVEYPLTAEQQSKISAGDLLLLKFTVKSEEGTGIIIPRILSSDYMDLVTYAAGSSQTNMTYYVPAQWTEICMPFEGPAAPIGFIRFDLSEKLQTVHIANVQLLNYGSEITVDDIAIHTGMFNLEEFEEFRLTDPGSNYVIGKTIDMVCKGNYLYSIGDNKLVISDISVPNQPVKISELAIDTTRQIAITEDGTAVLVTGRHDGVLVIDVSDPYNPYIRSRYDSVEMATGICIYDNYAYISNRQFGVEIVDIRNLDYPKHIALVRCNGEAQSCSVEDGILYIGLWGEQRVDMYDVTQPSNPVRLGSAYLNGRGDGVCIRKSADGTKTYLYAATGQHTYGVSNSSSLFDVRYGQGNGMDIFDVTEPSNPIWLSTVKIDGRFYYTNNDFWNTAFSCSEDGKEYVYLASTYNGVYVFDVTDPAAPVRKAHIYIPIQRNSVNWANLSSSSRKIIFPFNHNGNEIWGPVGSVVAKDGVLYVAGVYTDIHVFTNSELIHEEAGGGRNVGIQEDDGTFYNIPEDHFGLKNWV